MNKDDNRIEQVAGVACVIDEEIFSDVSKVTNLIEHKVELTEREPVRCKVYPTPYKMQEIVDKEIDDLLEMGVIERSEAPYASPLVLVKKPDNTYRVCVNFKELKKSLSLTLNQ